MSTAAFVLALLGLWGVARWGGAPGAHVAPAAAHLTLAEVARHDRAEDCWMRIDGSVYDLTPYLPAHPSEPSVIVRWCGKEATRAFATKDRGRPHSAYAARLLEGYRVGAAAAFDAPD